MNRDLSRVRWNEMLKYCDVDTAWLRFKSTLFELCNIHIPKITIRSEFQPPWYDSETHALCREKERWRARYKQTNNIEHYNKFSQVRKQFKKLVREKMNSTFEDDTDPSIISKKFWSHIKSKSNSHRIPETVSYGSRFRNNIKDQTELYNEYFYNQFSSPSNYDININFKNDIWEEFTITHQTVRSHLKRVNSNKAQGPDGIHGKILKYCAVSLAYPISLLFTTSLKTGAIPSEWKVANVVPVFKKGSKASVENYRPISLTCLISKILEKIVRDELMLKVGHQIDGSQHGFLPGKSCTTQMVPFLDSLSLTINDSSRCDVIYFDFAKAFDSVNHDIILHKLKHQYHIDGLMLKFLVNYLQNREQCVVIGGEKSSMKPVNSGVPQGSILGPLLFVLFINDMHKHISNGTNIALYADDTKIWRRIDNYTDHLILQRDILELFNWSNNNKMAFHPQKCKVLPVTLELQQYHLIDIHTAWVILAWTMWSLKKILVCTYLPNFLGLNKLTQR